MLSQNCGIELSKVASVIDKDTFTFIIPHGDLTKRPHLGDYVIVTAKYNNSEIKWLGLIVSAKEIVLDENEIQVKNILTKSELSPEECSIYLGTEYMCKLVGMFLDDEVTPTVRSLPCRTYQVRYPTYEELEQIAAIDSQGAEIGSLMVGGYKVYGITLPCKWKTITFKFSSNRIDKRRTAIFGQSGYGKSNLTKNLITNYAIANRNSCILIFDRSGEYGVSNVQSKTISDVNILNNRIKVYKMVEEKLNFYQIEASKIVEYFLEEKSKNTAAADYFYFFDDSEKNQVINNIEDAIKGAIGWEEARKNISAIIDNKKPNNPETVTRTLMKIIRKVVKKYHNASSALPNNLKSHLTNHNIVIFNFANMADECCNVITRYIVQEVMEINGEDFIRGVMPTNCLFLIEEAQNFLSEEHIKDHEDPVVKLAKEGRKYNLGLIYVTQQPSAIAKEILSQTNNIFSLHLLTDEDTNILCRIAPQFDFIKEYIQKEPIRGQAYVYSNVYDEKGLSKPFPVVISVDVELFDNIVEDLNKNASKYTNIYNSQRDYTKEVKDAFKGYVEDVFRANKDKDEIKISWRDLWEQVNNRLPNDNPYKNQYGRNNNYPAKRITKVISEEYRNRLIEIDGETVRIVLEEDLINNSIRNYVIVSEKINNDKNISNENDTSNDTNNNTDNAI